jgi:hypothetical protein
MLMTFNPAMNGWAIFREACRVMAKRLRDVCGLPEIESVFKRSHKVIMALTVQEILDEHIAKKLA